MKNKLMIIGLLLVVLVNVVGCSSSKTLRCSAVETTDGRKTTSDLVVKIRNEEVEDMTLTMDVYLSQEQQAYKYDMMYQMRAKTDQVYSTDYGINAIFGMDSDYFNTLGVSRDVSYSELKQVLELQGYTCNE